VLLDDVMSCEAIARVLLIDDDAIRTWYRLYREDGIEGLPSFGYEDGICRIAKLLWSDRTAVSAWHGASYRRRLSRRMETLLNRLSADEPVLFADAVHPTHAAWPVGCWAPKDVPVAITG
jgi:hypothetical protein